MSWRRRGNILVWVGRFPDPSRDELSPYRGKPAGRDKRRDAAALARWRRGSGLARTQRSP